jgi:dTDP-4-amino-4,6-dideoxygalactose transaminase
VKFGRFDGVDNSTTKESERLIRLPMYYGLLKEDINYLVATIYKYNGL